MWKFKSWKGKDKWLFLAVAGVILCILAFPAEQLAERGRTGTKAESGSVRAGEADREEGVDLFFGSDGQEAGAAAVAGENFQEGVEASAGGSISYEEQLEKRIRELLRYVDGVGKVDVLVVLKASSEKVIHVDGNITYSLTEETDGNGIRRKTESREETKDTVLSSGNGQNAPVIEKEIRPEISGIIISATGGGSPAVCAEISAAMEALFGLPPHKIKVLKRVE